MLQPLVIVKHCVPTHSKGSRFQYHYLNGEGRKCVKYLPFDYSQPNDRNQVIIGLRKLLIEIAPSLESPEVEYLGRNPLHPAEHILTYKFY